MSRLSAATVAGLVLLVLLVAEAGAIGFGTAFYGHRVGRSKIYTSELPADVNGDGFFDVLTLVETFNGKTFVAEIYYGPDLSEDEADMTRIVFEPPTGDVYSPDFLTAGHVMGPPGAAASDVVVTLIDRLHFRPTLFVFAGPMIQGETYFIANASARIDPPTTHICEFNHITLCDFNGDGAEDVVLATTQEYYTNSSEQVHVFHGPLLPGSHNLSSADVLIDPQDRSYGFTSSLACGDLDGDTFADLAVGASNWYNGTGATFVFWGEASPAPVLSTANGTLVPGFPFNYSDYSNLACGGRVHTGFFNDSSAASNSTILYVSCLNYENSTGVIWAYSDLNKTSLVNEPMHGFLGGEPSSIFGSELAIGDINGDGTQDLIVASGLLTTQVDIFMDPNGNQVDFITPLSASNITIHAAHTADGFGTQIAALGDLDKDGYEDVIITAPHWSAGCGYSAFEVYLGNNASALTEARYDYYRDVWGDQFACPFCLLGWTGPFCDIRVNPRPLQFITTTPTALPLAGGSIKVFATGIKNGSTSIQVDGVDFPDAVVRTDDNIEFNAPPSATAGYTKDFSFINPPLLTNPAVLTLKQVLFYVDSDCIEEGFWKHPTSGVCLPCPEGGFCPGGGRVWPIKGYWSFNETLAPGQCVPLVACPGAIGETPGYPPSFLDSGARQTQVCATHLGYEGEFCSACNATSYRDYEVCRPCAATTAEDKRQLVALIFVSIFIFIALAVAVATLPDKWLDGVTAAVVAIQQFVVVGRIASAQFKDVQESFIGLVFQRLSVVLFQVEFIRPGCSIGKLSFVGVFWWSLVIILIAAAFFAIAAFARSYYYKKQDDTSGIWQKKLKWRLVRSMIILGTLVYLQFTITALSGVSCSREGDGTLRLNAELRTPCYQGAHLPVALLTWVLIFAFCIGFPAALLYYAIKAYRRGLDDAKRKEKYGYIYRGLKAPFFWFRLLTYGTSFAIAVTSVISVPIYTKVFVTALLFVLNVLAVGIFLPFLAWYDNVFRIFAGIASALLTLLLLKEVDEEDPHPLFFVLLVITSLVIIVLLVVNCVRIGREAKAIRDDNDFTSTRIGGNSNYATSVFSDPRSPSVMSDTSINTVWAGTGTKHPSGVYSSGGMLPASPFATPGPSPGVSDDDNIRIFSPFSVVAPTETDLIREGLHSPVYDPANDPEADDGAGVNDERRPLTGGTHNSDRTTSSGGVLADLASAVKAALGSNNKEPNKGSGTGSGSRLNHSSSSGRLGGSSGRSNVSSPRGHLSRPQSARTYGSFNSRTSSTLTSPNAANADFPMGPPSHGRSRPTTPSRQSSSGKQRLSSRGSSGRGSSGRSRPSSDSTPRTPRSARINIKDPIRSPHSRLAAGATPEQHLETLDILPTPPPPNIILDLPPPRPNPALRPRRNQPRMEGVYGTRPSDEEISNSRLSSTPSDPPGNNSSGIETSSLASNSTEPTPTGEDAYKKLPAPMPDA